MPIMKSQAGDMAITIDGMTTDGTNLIAQGKMGMWQATIIMSSEEVTQMIPLMLNRKIIGFILKLPYLTRKAKKEAKKAAQKRTDP